MNSYFPKETIVWGFPSAFGVFLAEYLKNPVYLSQPGATSLLPLIGSLSTGIIYCSGEHFRRRLAESLANTKQV